MLLALVAAVASASPGYRHGTVMRPVLILRDDRVIEDNGRYNFDVETSNGIVMSESGSPGAEGAINSAGSFS